MKQRMAFSDLESAMPITGEKPAKAAGPVLWIDPPPSSGVGVHPEYSGGGSDPELPAAGRLHSCEYCEWGYFGNEASYVDFYIYASLQVTVPKPGEGVRKKSKSLAKTAKKKAGEQEVLPSAAKKQKKVAKKQATVAKKTSKVAKKQPKVTRKVQRAETPKKKK